MPRGSDRRRDAASYVLSLLIHLLALGAFLALLRHELELDAPEAALTPDTTLDIAIETPSPHPTLAPTETPATPLPVPTLRISAASLLARSRPTPPAARRPNPAPHELARIVPHAPLQPTPAPRATEPPATAAPLVIAAASSRPTVAPTVVPTAEPAPTHPPTLEPTRPPTPEPTRPPTPEPTRPPTPEATRPPTIAPTVAPTRPATARPTIRPTAVPTSAPTAAPTAAVAAATRAPFPAATRGTAVAAATPGADTEGTAKPSRPPSGPALPQSPQAEPRTEPSAAVAYRAPSGAGGPSSLNERLKAALPTGPGGGLKHYDLGSYQTNRVLDAYEASLAPPLEVLARTFGLIYTSRTAFRADEVQYVYERTRVLGVEVCKAYTIVEHPLRDPAPKEEHVGLGAPSSGNPTGLAQTGPLRDLKPEISTQVVPCNAKGMIPVAPGSLKSPVPRHAEDFVPPSAAP